MNTLAVEVHPQAHDIKFTEADLSVELMDGRTIAIPLVWFPRLSKGSEKELNKWELLGDGEGIHWPDIDEDLSIAGILAGAH